MIHPLVERELRIALHRRNRRKTRLQIAALATGVSIVFILLSFPALSRIAGSSLQSIFFYAGLYFSIIPALQSTVGLFAEERRNQTLDLLFLTGMNSFELFIGKLLGGTIVALDNLLGLLPFLSLPFLIGGISLETFAATIVCFPCILLFTVAIAVLSSVLTSDEGTALALALVMVSVLCLATTVPYSFGSLIGGKPPFSSDFLLVSPAYALYLVQQSSHGGSLAKFWPTIEITIVTALLAILVAGIVLNLTWREDPDRRGIFSRVRRTFPACCRILASRFKANSQTTDPIKTRVLHDRRAVGIGWTLTLGMVLVWLLGWLAWPGIWLSTANFFITAFLLISAFHVSRLWAGARLMARDRRENTLELILTTPISSNSFISDQIDAIRSQFEPLRRVVLGLCCSMMIGGLFIRSWNINALIVYAIIWLVYFAWSCATSRYSLPSVMWVALNSGRSAFALFHASGGGGWQWLWILYNVRALPSLFRRTIQFPTGSTPELVIVIFVFIVGFIIVAANQGGRVRMYDQLVDDLRRIARTPIPDPADPRFKTWDVRYPFPTPRG
jgi:hypothetical protein